MNRKIQNIFLLLFLCLVSLTAKAQKNSFTAAEQQQISIATPGLFERSNVFNIDLKILSAKEYSFPLPVGKATLKNNLSLEITSVKGDIVLAMFDGIVRLARKTPQYGNVVVIRHDNGLETVYAFNEQNHVKVGQQVRAGQKIATVGGQDDRVFCLFSIMVNGGGFNPTMIVEPRSHRLQKNTIQCRKNGKFVDVSILQPENKAITSLDPDDVKSDPFENSLTFKLDLESIGKERWAYPLPGSHVISPYGGKRRHPGVDIKTRANDNIVAAFDGVVTRSGPYFGYGNCIVIKHAYGFETLYSHQSKNLVKVGQKVKAGQVIGLTGRTGRATTEHLHFEVSFKGRRLNPAVIFDHTKKCLNAKLLTLGKNGSINYLKH